MFYYFCIQRFLIDNISIKMSDLDLLLIAIAVIVLYYGFVWYGATHRHVFMGGAGAVVLVIVGILVTKYSDSYGDLSTMRPLEYAASRMSPNYTSTYNTPEYANPAASTRVPNRPPPRSSGGIPLVGGDINLMENVYCDA
jgi:hypothetical protein